MQCIERRESESSECAGPISGWMARCNGDGSGFEPQPSGKSIFTRILLVLEIVSRRAYEMECPGLSHVQDCRHRLRFPSDSLDRCVIEWPLEAAEVEVDHLAHSVIVLSATRSCEKRKDSPFEPRGHRSGVRQVSILKADVRLRTLPDPGVRRSALAEQKAGSIREFRICFPSHDVRHVGSVQSICKEGTFDAAGESSQSSFQTSLMRRRRNCTREPG